MTGIDWAQRIKDAAKRCDDWGREEYLDMTDDVVAGLNADAILAKHKVKPTTLANALAHISASVHGPRPVPALAEGGWYEDKDGDYTVNPEFAKAWLAARPPKTKH